eukprot:gene4430-biopygen6791
MNPTSASSKLTTTMNIDEYGTLQADAPNESVPVAINDIGFFQAISMMIKYMQTPCPPQHYRTGCEELMSSGNCTRCPTCSVNEYRSGCGGATEGVCLHVTTCGCGEFEVQAPTPTSDRVFCCANPSSRSTLTFDHIYEVVRVDNCCCDAFSLPTWVNSTVNVRSSETMLHFRTIQEVGAYNGEGPSGGNRESLQVVNFGEVTRVSGNVNLH